MAERMPRDLEVREKTTRPKAWAPPSLLPDPAPQDGWRFRWVRISALGTPDATNASTRMREGWEPVRAEDHPELALSFGGTNKAGHVEIGGLLLCKAPAEMMDQRQAYYENQARTQMKAVNSNFMRENDPRMPLFTENSTEVKFGSGTK